MSYCKICFKENNEYTWNNVLCKSSYICNSCFESMNPKLRIRKAEGFVHISLYEYNDFVKSLLYQYKACKDVELSSVFISRQAPILNMVFHKYIVVPGPSYHCDRDTNEFNHVIEMFKPLGLPIYDCISKIKDIKQKDLTYAERHKIKDNLTIKNPSYLQDKKVLFVDDLFTTGSTSIACANLIKNAGAKKVIILTMGRVVFI